MVVTLALLGGAAHATYWTQRPERLWARKSERQWHWRRPSRRLHDIDADDTSESTSRSSVCATDVPLAALEQRLRTGDILLTRSSNFPSQRLHYVAAATYSPWAHVALLLRHPDTGALCVATSDEQRYVTAVDDGTPLLDVFGQKRPSGVAVYALRTYLRTFDVQALAVRALNMPLDDAAVWRLITDEQLYARAYPKRSLIGYAGMLTARSVGSNFVTRRLEHAELRDGAAMHCSGLVGYVYEQMGVALPHARGHWRYWLPRDFDQAADGSGPLRLAAGHALGPLVFVDLDSL